ncbi:MAG: hypothetical protein GY749_34200 [Desulfobacteraceae bacterium]|nr:hypothetical protein [Desulfobacteraceae bacterium]
MELTDWHWAVDSVYRMPDVFHADSVLPKQPASDRIQLNTDRKQFICRVVQ